MFDNVTMNDLMIGFSNSRIQSKKAQKWSGTKYTMNRVKNGHVNAKSKTQIDHRKKDKRVKPTSYRMWDKLSGEWQELKCSERTFNKLKAMGEKVERDGSKDTFMGDIVAQFNKVGWYATSKKWDR